MAGVVQAWPSIARHELAAWISAISKSLGDPQPAFPVARQRVDRFQRMSKARNLASAGEAVALDDDRELTISETTCMKTSSGRFTSTLRDGSAVHRPGDRGKRRRGEKSARWGRESVLLAERRRHEHRGQRFTESHVTATARCSCHRVGMPG